MAFNNTVQDFRDKFKGTRSNRFIITPGTPPAGIVPTVGGKPEVDDFKLYAKATSYPGSAIGMIPVSYQGRVVKYSGERQFAEWSIQVYDSSVAYDGVNLRKYFENWITLGDHPVTHKQQYNIASSTPWQVAFDDITGTVGGGDVRYKKTLFLHNCWPIDISAIDLNYEAADSFAEFTLTLAYDFHKIDASPTS